MNNNAEVILGWREMLPEVPYIKRTEFVDAVKEEHDHALHPCDFHRWPGVKNTWTYEVGRDIYTRYHETDICCIDTVRDLVTLTPQGFYTRTTLNRLNQVLSDFSHCENSPSIFQKKKQWWLSVRHLEGDWKVVPFEEGLEVTRRGYLHGDTIRELPEEKGAQGRFVNPGFMG